MQTELFDIFNKVTVTEQFAQQLEKTKLLSCDVDVPANRVSLCLKSDFYISRTALLHYADAIQTVYGLHDCEIRMDYTSFPPDSLYYQELIHHFLLKNGGCRAFLSDAKVSLQGTSLTIENIKGGQQMIENRNFSDFIREASSAETGFVPEINLVFAQFDREGYLKRTEMEEMELVQKTIATVSLKNANAKEPSPGIVLGKGVKQPVMPIIDLYEGMGSCAVEGEILQSEVREIKRNNRPTGNTVITFDLADEQWACTCSIFSRTERLGGLAKAAVPGKRIRVQGNYEMDDYTHKFMIKLTAAELLEGKTVREDHASKKRVELHMHTKMSAMDAVSSVGDLVARAAKWGHKAIAVTDHGVAQAFPDAHKAAAKAKGSVEGFKVLYGVEGYLINDTDSAKLGLARLGREKTYVVFDIETTGLKAQTDRITEIGAVKIVNGTVAETFSQLINPQIPIPAKIVDLTGITDAMVKDQPTIEEVLPKFLDFCGDHTVVTHNANFDTGFIRQKAIEQNLVFHNGIVDTLKLSRELFPQHAKHTLDTVAKRVGVSLENHHRAVDDATATAEIFLKFMEMIEEQNHGNMPEEVNIDTNPELIKNPRYHIIILAKNYTGLKNLYKLISKSNLNYFYKKPIMPKSVIKKLREGLLIGSACEAGELFRAMAAGKSDTELEEIASFYDYLEIQPIANNSFMLRNGSVSSEEDLRNYNRKIVKLGDKLGMPTVATCDVHFMDPEDEVYRRVLMGAQGFQDADEQAPLYLRTTDEMLEEFSYLGPEKAEEVVITNTNKIADMIDDIQPVKDGSYPPTIENCEQDLVDMCHKKAHDIYGEVLPPVVQERMDRELDCITKYGYSVMYMIAHKLVKKSNEAGYLVGSRGSVGSSFAAFLSGITEVNALCPHYICPGCKHSEFFENGEYAVGMDMPDKVCPDCGTMMKKDGLTIPFETFLGFKGDKVPDIDLNFSGEYQATAHKYVGELFGDKFVFKAGTIGTIADKTAYGFARKYYEQKGIEAPDAELLRVSKGMVDVKRTTGQHPGGIIVCPKTMDIHDFCPIQHPADKKDSDIITTHFDFHSIHDNLLKLDILGHDDPSTIRMLEDLTGLNALEIPFDDQKVMSLFSGTEALGVTPQQIGSEVGTFGVPEFGTSFVRQMLVDTKPTTFVELLIISGLSHGTDVWLNNAQDLVRSKTATLSEVIGLRDDIMVYLIQHGLEPGTAFKIMEFVRKGRAAKEGMPPDFEAAMKENGVPGWYIDSCKKIKYMFPKAHAAAYVMMAFRIAYFKVYYPVEFYIAYFTVRADLFDAALMTKGVQKVKDEMRKLTLKSGDMTQNEKSLYTILEICLEMYERGITFLPVDLYKSHARKFQKIGNAILPPLNAFAGVGDAAAEAIMEAAKEGPFISQDDLKNRAKINKSVVETLRENGVLDELPETSQISIFDMLG